MKLSKSIRALGAALLVSLALTGCGKSAPPSQAEPTPAKVHFAAGDVELSAQELTMPLAAGETELLASLPALQTADLRGSDNEEEVAVWALTHPQVRTRFTLTLPSGAVVENDLESFDLRGLSPEECARTAEKLALLPGLKSVELGAEGGSLTWADIGRLREYLPDAVFHYAFTLYGKACNLADTTINLFRVPVTDDGKLIDQVMYYMPQLSYVDMDSCGLSPKRLEEINLNHPGAKVVFRVYFGDNYTARTDTERILASMASRGGMLTNDNVDGLYYCHDVKYLDLGHNTDLTNMGFLAQMPKLEVAILAMCNVSDLTPLASCPELEYLEIANTYAADLRPLSGLTKLRHLNVAGIGFDQPYDGSDRIQLKDISPLYGLTGLERLWIGAYNPVPAEQVEEMHRRAPNCEIDLTVYDDPVGGRWRYIALADYETTYVDTLHERYAKLRQQFDDYAYTAYNFTWNDPLCDPNYDPATAPSPTPSPTPTPYVPPQTYDPAEESWEDSGEDEAEEPTWEYTAPDPYLSENTEETTEEPTEQAQETIAETEPETVEESAPAPEAESSEPIAEAEEGEENA